MDYGGFLLSARRVGLGLSLIVVGQVILIERLGGLEQASPVLRRWWPLLLVALGLVGLAKFVTRPWVVLGPVIVIGAGATLLLKYWLTEQDFDRVFWPAILTFVGLIVALSEPSSADKDFPHQNSLRRSIWLRVSGLRSKAADFSFARIMVVMGVFELDLREAVLRKSANVSVTAILGAVHIIVPPGVAVHVRRPFVLGRSGIEWSGRASPTIENGLNVSALAFFGKVSLKHWTVIASSLEESTVTDLRIRYRRLSRSTSVAFGTAIAVVVGFLPLGISALLLAVPVQVWPLPWELLAQYAAWVLFILGCVWLLLIFLRQFQDRRVDMLGQELAQILAHASDSASPEPYRLQEGQRAYFPGQKLSIVDRKNAEVRGFSLIALWQEVEPLLSPTEWHELNTVLQRERRLGYFGHGCILALLAIGATFVLGNIDGSMATLYPLMGAVLFSAAASLVESSNASNERFALQVAATLRHAEELSGAFGIPNTSAQERQEALRLLSLRILTGMAGAPSSVLTLTQQERQLARIVDRSVDRSLSPRPVVNITGSLRFRRVESSSGRAKLEVAIWTGESELAAEDVGDRQWFRLTGGVDADTAPLRIVVTSPGLQVVPRRSDAVVRTTGDFGSWFIDVVGFGAETAEAWLTVYCSDRFVRAAHIEAANS
jgi:hypothetical protein